LSNGRKADYLKTLLPRYPDKAKKASIGFLADTAEDMKVRAAAMKGCFFSGSEEAKAMRAKYPDVMAKFGPGDFMNVIRTAASNGDFKLQREMTGYWKAAKGVYSYEALRLELQLYAAVGTPAEINDLIANAESCGKLKDAERLNFIFSAKAILLNDKEGEFTKFFNGYPFPANVSGKEKNDILIDAGRYAMNARKYVIAEESCKVRDAMFKPEPKKTYVIGFCDKPISGISDFLRNAADAQVQKLDRKYGGNMDFLVTDVSTGDRAADIGSAQKKASAKSSDMMIACDKFGVHLLFKIYDDKAAEIEAGTIGADSFEMYFSPGVDQPYYCFLPNVVDGSCGIWNSTYANAQWTRINDKSSKEFRTERIYTDDGYYMYIFVTWKVFYDKLPDAGDIWNFENIHWSRFGGYSWNGIKTIHGRSTWRNLQFKISPEQMLEIKRDIIFEAKRIYQSEKRTTGKKHGVIEMWKADDVLGDPKFYEEQVKPMVDKLDSYLADVTPNMSAETIEKVYREAVPGWMNIRYSISEIRKDYLENGFTR